MLYIFYLTFLYLLFALLFSSACRPLWKVGVFSAWKSQKSNSREPGKLVNWYQRKGKGSAQASFHPTQMKER